MSETATGTVLNDLKGIINVKGTNSSGMTLASDTDTVSITNKGKINVDGTGSKGITSTKGGAVNNEGTITIADGSAAIEAAGGTVNNKAGASITTEKDSSADGINISSNANSGATVTNDGTITVNGSGSAINSSISATSPAETSNTINNNGVITITGTETAFGPTRQPLPTPQVPALRSAEAVTAYARPKAALPTAER
mgnify:CR=1 FL=1